MKLFVVIGILSLLFGSDAMKISKQTTITLDDEQDQIDTSDVARLLGLTDESIVAVDVVQEIFTGCSKGKCEVCKSVVGQKLCLEAVLLKQGFSVEVKVDGKQVFKKEVTIPTPPPFCISKIPGLDKLSDLCLKLDKVDLTKKSACAEITVKVKVGPVKKNIKVDLGCFTIPAVEDGKKESADLLGTDEISNPFIGQFFGIAGDKLNSDTDVKAPVDDVLDNEDLIGDDSDDGLLLKGCSKGKCEVCKSVVGQKLCLEAVLLKQGFSVEVKVDGKQVFKKEVTIPTPPPFCISKIPGLDKLSDLCLKLDKVDLTKKSACAEITVKVKVGPVKKNVKVDLGCFTIPAVEDDDREANVFEDDNEKITEEDVSQLFGITDDETDAPSNDFDDTTDDVDLAFDDFTENTADFGMLTKGCSKGKCEVCKRVIGLKMCLEAVLLKQGFSVEVKISGKRVFKKEISIQSPPLICVSHIPGLEKLSDLCLKLEKVDLKKKSACAEITVKAKMGPVKKTIKVTLGCFCIPALDDSTVTLNDDALTFVPHHSGNPVDMVEATSETIDPTEDNLAALISELLADTAEEFDINLEGVINRCKNSKCTLCTPGKHLKLCVIAAALPHGVFELAVTLDGRQVYHYEVSVANPPPFCFNYHHFYNICLQVYNIDLKQRSACVRVTFKVLAKKINIKLGCFKIPLTDVELLTPANVLGIN